MRLKSFILSVFFLAVILAVVIGYYAYIFGIGSVDYDFDIRRYIDRAPDVYAETGRESNNNPAGDDYSNDGGSSSHYNTDSSIDLGNDAGENSASARHSGNEHSGSEVPFDGMLDTSSGPAFMADVKEVYGIRLKDNGGFLSGTRAMTYMSEIERALSLFSPGFILDLVDIYAGYGTSLSIILERSNANGEEASGVADWNDDTMMIYLYHNKNPEESGINAQTLAHELGHTIHYIIEEQIGEAQSEWDLLQINGSFPYVEDNYANAWDESIHSTAFAYNYGMYSHYEDVATIFEKLVEEPDVMRMRLSIGENETLFRKVWYISEMTNAYVSGKGSALFAPFYDAQKYWIIDYAA